MGEYINLIAAMNRKHSDAPSVVCQRYACDQPQTTVNFTVKADTRWGENIYLVGDHPLPSEWVPAAAIKLSPEYYPVWNVTVSLPAGKSFEYRYVKRDASGKIDWESGSNRSFTTPASGEVSLADEFR